MTSVEKAKKLSEAARELEKAKSDVKHKEGLLQTAVRQGIGVDRYSSSLDSARRRLEEAQRKYNNLT